MKTRLRLLMAGKILGVLMMLAPFVVVAWAARSAIATLGASGIGDPHSLSAAIAEILASAAAGFFLVPLGLGVVIFSFVASRHLHAPVPPPLPSAVP